MMFNPHKLPAAILICCLILIPAGDFAQSVAKYKPGANSAGFEEEINAFLRQDSAGFPPERAYLFTGSSTIRMWDSLSRDFSEIEVIRRGFGGSTMKALNFYFNDIVLPYKPRHIIVYEGDNDFINGTTLPEFIAQCDTFIGKVRRMLPRTTIWFLSIKPSPVRLKYLDTQQEANRRLKSLTEKYKKTRFIDLSGLMYNDKGLLRKELFLSDSLHLTRECYRLWSEKIKQAMKIRN